VNFAIEVRNGATVVAQVTHPVYICGPGDELTSESSEPMLSSFRMEIDAGVPVRTLTWSTPQTIRRGETLLGTGTSVVIREGVLPLLDSIDSLRVRAYGPTEVRYINESTAPIIAMPAQDKFGTLVLAVGLAVLGMLTIRRYSVARRSQQPGS
jgi:hypothetical protein